MEAVCPVCENMNGIVLKDESLKMLQCPQCGHAFSLIDDDLQEEYTELYYDVTHANWFNNPNFRLFKFIYLHLIKMLKRDTFKLLDVGCGKGDFLKYIHSVNPKIRLYGVDLCGNNFTYIKFSKMDYLAEKYEEKCDAICSLAAIEHMYDISYFVEKIKGNMCKGGFLVITTDNVGGVFYKTAGMLKKIGITAPFYSLYEPAHLHHFTNHSLKLLLESHGFEVKVQKNHNYPVKAVSLPKSNILTKLLYICAVSFLFSLPEKFGILQTVICKRKCL